MTMSNNDKCTWTSESYSRTQAISNQPSWKIHTHCGDRCTPCKLQVTIWTMIASSLVAPIDFNRNHQHPATLGYLPHLNPGGTAIQHVPNFACWKVSIMNWQVTELTSSELGQEQNMQEKRVLKVVAMLCTKFMVLYFSVVFFRPWQQVLYKQCL